MDKDEALKLLRDLPTKVWNDYRDDHPDWQPDLAGEKVHLGSTGFDLSNAILAGATVTGNASHDYTSADLCGADLGGLDRSYLGMAKLDKANFDVLTRFPAHFDPSAKGAVFVTRQQRGGETGSSVLCFISYAWANEEVITALDAWLRRKGIQTRLDKRDFFAGSRIRDEIVRVMQECSTILIFHSAQSLDKPWTEFERELAGDLEIEAKKQGTEPPRIIYVVLDDAELPTVSETNRIAVMAKGKRFELVCEEIYHGILQIPRAAEEVDLEKWSNYVF